MIYEFVRASAQGVYWIVTLTYPSPCQALSELPWHVVGGNIHQYEVEDTGLCRVRYRASEELPEYYKTLDVERENAWWKRHWAARYKMEPGYPVLYITGRAVE